LTTEPGTGNINADPQFVDISNPITSSGFHLKPNSPCIDAGRFVDGLSEDFDANQRPYDAVTWETRGDGSDFDIGAYEFIGEAQLTPTPTPTPTPIPTPNLPEVVISTPDGIQGEYVEIPFILFDEASEPTSIWVKYSLDSGETWNWAWSYKDPQLCTNNLTSSPQGTSHIFPWRAGLQAKCNMYDQVRILIGPYNSKGYGYSDYTNDFTVDNLFQLPRAKLYASSILKRAAYIPVYYSLYDCTNDLTDIYIKYSKDAGNTWNWITHAPGGDGTTNLETSEEGVIHHFVWNAAQDLGTASCPDCKLLMYTLNTKGVSGPWHSDFFSVDNPDGPWIRIYKPENGTGNTITVYYRLYDYQSVPTSIEVRYSSDNGMSSSGCVDAPGGDGREYLAASPEGVLHSYNWDVESDIGCGQFDQLIIYILPYNIHGSGVCQRTDSFSWETCK